MPSQQKPEITGKTCCCLLALSAQDPETSDERGTGNRDLPSMIFPT